MIQEPKTEKARIRKKNQDCWYRIKNRCDNEKWPGYKNYGGRGITYCTKWKTFEGFMEDMGKTYKEGLSIDRINNNGNYCKKNCRWTDMVTQENNRRDNHKIIYKGVTMTISQWARKLNTYPQRITQRLKRGWSVNKIMTIPFVLFPQRRNCD